MAGLADVKGGNPGTWEAARELGKQLTFPVGPYEARVPTADEMNAVLPYIMDRMSRFVTDKYYCENAEVTLAHILGINVPRFGFPDSSGYNNNARNHNGYGRDWEGFDRNGLDVNGRNREGRDRNGYDKDGLDKDGYNYYGRDKEGFDRKGRNQAGHTRDEAIQALVIGWSDDFAVAIAIAVAQLKAADETVTVVEAVVTPAKKAAKAAPAKKTATTAKKGVPTKKAPPRKVAPKKLVTAAV